MKLYIAGASKEPERVRAMMDAAKALGFELTLDWLAAIAADGGVTNEGLTQEKRVQYTDDDLRAVKDARIVWVLAPENQSTGTWCEMQHAVDVRDWGFYRVRCVIVSGSGRHRCIFASQADHEFDTDDEALECLRALLGVAA